MTIDYKTKISYLTARRKYEKLLRERHLVEQRWSPQGSQAVGAFVKPFSDVFKALKLTAMDIGNSARLMLGVLLTWDPDKLQKKRDKFNERRDKLRTLWNPIIGDSLKAIQTADPLLSFALIPGVYFASLGLATGITTGKVAAEVMAGETWSQLINKLERMPTEKSALNAILNVIDGDKDKKGTKTLDKLSKLFFGENHARSGSILKELEEKQETEYDMTSEESWLKSFMADTGLDDVFNKIVIDLAEGHTSIIKEIAESTGRMEVGALLVAATSPEDFKSVLTKSVNDKIIEAEDVKELSGVLSQIEKQAKELAASDDFRAKLAKTKNVEPDAMDDAAVFAEAEKTAFNTGKIDFNEQAVNGDGKSPGLIKLMEEIKSAREEVSLDSDLLGQLKKRTDLPAVKELLQIYESVGKNYDKAQRALATAQAKASN